MSKKVRLPRPKSIELIKIKKVFQDRAYGEFLNYPNVEAFLPIKEVSSKWINSVKEVLRENQIVAVLVMSVDRNKLVADVSLRKVKEEERKKKIEEYHNEVRCRKLITALLKKHGYGEKYIKNILDIYESLYDFCLDAYDDESVIEEVGLPKEVGEDLLSTLKRMFKPPVRKFRKVYVLEVYEPNGVEIIKEVFGEAEKLGFKVTYLGAPRYMLEKSSEDMKSVLKEVKAFEKKMAKLLSRVKHSLSEEEE